MPPIRRSRCAALLCLFLSACHSGRVESTDDSEGDRVTSAEHGEDVDAANPLRLQPMPGQNVIVIQMDTLRADHLPHYGYARDTAPGLGALPLLAVTGERPSAGWTLPSSASLLTGLSPQHHQLVFFYEKHTPNGPLLGVSFPERLQDEGYATGLFSGNDVVSEYTGLDAGFDTSVIRMKSTPDSGANGGGTLATLGEDALDWIDGLPDGQPFHAHLQPMNMHQPLVIADADLAMFRSTAPTIPKGAAGGYQYADFITAHLAATDPPAKAALHQSLVDIYDAALFGLDRETTDFLSALDSRGLLSNTTVVFTADHGETLDDEFNGYWGHGEDLREELTRIPLLILQPGAPGGAATCVSSNADLWPTLWGAMDLEPPTGLDGVDLADGCRLQAGSSRFSEEGVTHAAAGSEVGKIAVHCEAATALGTDVGPGADVSEQTSSAEVNEGDVLVASVRGDLDEIQSLLGGPACPFE